MNIDYTDYFGQDDQIRLRPIRPEDWEFDYMGRFDTPARRLLECTTELPPTMTECRKFAEENAEFLSTNGRIMFTIETVEGLAVGGINLNSIDERNGTFSIGIVLDKPCRGIGYGTRAMKILLRYAFLERRLNKFNDSVLEGNIASGTMMEKLGCVREGVRRQVAYIDGKFMDFILYGMTKDEFVAAHKKEAQS